MPVDGVSKRFAESLRSEADFAAAVDGESIARLPIL